jgi:hypothetical protein
VLLVVGVCVGIILMTINDDMVWFVAGDDIDMSEILDPHVCASLLKQYFRELPEPLLTYEFYDCFLAAACMLCTTLALVAQQLYEQLA